MPNYSNPTSCHHHTVAASSCQTIHVVWRHQLPRLINCSSYGQQLYFGESSTNIIRDSFITNFFTSSHSYKRKTSSPVFGEIKLELPLPAGVSKRTAFSRSKLLSVVASTRARHPWRTVSFSVSSSDLGDKDVLVVTFEAFRSDNSESKPGCDDC